jgi:molybdopterin molybdotransferase
LRTFIGFTEALELTLSHVAPGAEEELPLLAAVGRVLAADLASMVDSPSISTSRKDGFAVVPEDLNAASHDHPIGLKLVGRCSAGDIRPVRMNRGEVVRVTTGAPIPAGAQAVISEEFCRVEDSTVFCFKTAESDRNILHRGTDVRSKDPVAARGDRLTPARLGLIAAAGHGAVRVHRMPRAAVIATGDEVVSPGQPLPPGKLYASNMVEIGAWLSLQGIPFKTAVIPDRPQAIREAVQSCLSETGVFITSGGAWGSEKDLMLKVMADMGWTGIYHRVRMGPGKPVGFGLLDGRPFFVLPGGPPSNEMAFLQLCLPALMKMMGLGACVFPTAAARLSEPVRGERSWTEFVHAHLEKSSTGLTATPIRLKSRLKSMAEKEALIVIPEDRDAIPAGETIEVQVLGPTVDRAGAAS